MDAVARLLAQGLSDRWPVRVIVENRGGAAGNLGGSVAAKAAPDGYTLLVWNDTMLINPALFKEVPFDPKRDFQPISLAMYSPNILVAHPSAGFRTVADFLHAARSNPGKLTYASPGNGSSGHLSFEILKSLAGLDITHVPYRSAGPAVADLVAGQVPLGMVSIPGAIGQVSAGALVGLGVTSRARAKALPDVPTIAEAGIPNYQINAFHGVFGPAGMPPAITAFLEKEISAVLKDSEVSKKIVNLGFDPVSGNSADLAAIIDRDLPVWREYVVKSGAKAE